MVMSKTKKELEAIKQELLLRKQDLDQKLTQLNEKVTDEREMDPADQAASSTMELLKSSFQNTELDEYRNIELALDKINEGTYGICVDCGEPISDKRLNLNPNSSRCLVCQEALEERE